MAPLPPRSGQAPRSDQERTPVAVVMSPGDLAALEETLDVLSDPSALADIQEADAARTRGDVVRARPHGSLM